VGVEEGGFFGGVTIIFVEEGVDKGGFVWRSFVDGPDVILVEDVGKKEWSSSR
jgi:hypothetical protein